MRHLLISLLALLCLPVALVNAAPETTLTSHGITLLETLKYGKDFQQLDYVNPNAPKGGKVTLAAIGTFDSLNPFILKGNPAAMSGLFFDTLLATPDDESSSAYGLLAESITRPVDNDWVEFTLRKEATFSDGTPVTAQDVVFTFNLLKKDGSPHYRAYYTDVKSVEAKSDRTVRFTFATTENRELPFILGEFPILSEASLKNVTFADGGMTPLLGSGPYKLGKATPGKSITFERRDDYWAKDLPLNKGRYNFDQIQIDYYRDETVAVQALNAGAYDFREENIARIWATAYDSPAFKEGKIKKENIKHKIPSGMQGMFFNTRREQFSDRRVRKAFALAYDFEWANQNLFFSSYTRSLSYFTNSELASAGLPSKAETALLEPFRADLPPETFTTAFSLPVNSGPEDNRTYLTAARALLEAAGWKIRGGKLANEKGDTFKVEFLLSSPAFERVIAPYIKNLKTLGIEATLRFIDPAQYQKRLENFDFDIITHVYGESLSPGNEQRNYWHSTSAFTPGSLNLAGINNKAVDTLVDKIIKAPDRQSLITATRALDRVLLNEYYCVPGWHLGSWRIVYWDKFGRPEKAPTYGLDFPHSWWAKETTAEKPPAKP